MFWFFVHEVCGILALQPENEPTPPTPKANPKPRDHHRSPHILYSTTVLLVTELWISHDNFQLCVSFC